MNTKEFDELIEERDAIESRLQDNINDELRNAFESDLLEVNYQIGSNQITH